MIWINDANRVVRPARVLGAATYLDTDLRPSAAAQVLDTLRKRLAVVVLVRCGLRIEAPEDGLRLGRRLDVARERRCRRRQRRAWSNPLPAAEHRKMTLARGNAEAVEQQA